MEPELELSSGFGSLTINEDSSFENQTQFPNEFISTGTGSSYLSKCG
jgi:hypothetical protein